MNVNKVSKAKSKSKQDEVGTSSSNTTMTWKSACRSSLRSWVGSKSTRVSPNLVGQSGSKAAQKTAVPDPPPYNLRKEVEKSKDSTVAEQEKEIHKKEEPIDSAKWQEIAQKTVIYSDIPTYHIRLDDDEEHMQFGEKCILCNKDLSSSPNGVDHRSRMNDEHKYRVKFIPQILPAADILPCGHAIHTECSKYVMSAESNVPRCVFCLSMP